MMHLHYFLVWNVLQYGLMARCTQVPLSLNPNQVLNSNFSEYVNHLRELWDVKGIAMSVILPDGAVEFGAWGNRTEDGELMTPNTLFGIASCSKAFLATSIGILFEDYAQGRNSTPLPSNLHSIGWDTKIKDVLPGEWELQDEWATEKANFRDILSHTSGMPRHDASYGPSYSTADIVRRLKFLRPAHELRQKFSYNNQMYMVGAHIISKLTGSYIEFATKHIFKPLGMDSTTFSPDAAAKSSELTQTWTAHGQRIPYWLTEEEKEMQAGAGSIISNVVDLSKWLKELLSARNRTDSKDVEGIKQVDIAASEINTFMDSRSYPQSVDTVIPKSVFDAVTTSHVIEKGRPLSPEFSVSGYGAGWFRFSYQGHEVISHSGAIPGSTSHVSFFPDDGFGIATLLNAGDKNKVAVALHYRAAEELLGLPHKFSTEEPPSPSDHPPGLSNSTTPLPLSAYAGTYANPGYGSFTLCDPGSTSNYCDRVLSDFQSVDAAQSIPLPPRTDVLQLFGTWPRVWSSHLRLVHASNNTNIFNISFTGLFPEGYGASKIPFETYELDNYEGQVEFVINKTSNSVIGFGWYGVNDMSGVKDDGTSVKEGAIAWFDRV